jgi:hypothetical protein
MTLQEGLPPCARGIFPVEMKNFRALMLNTRQLLALRARVLALR